MGHPPSARALEQIPEEAPVGDVGHTTGETVKLIHPGGTAEFPIARSVDGASSIEMSTLMKQTGLTSLDPGFVNTASTRSAITYIDGDQGILRYRGYPIEELAKQSTYLEVAWLLI